MTQTSLSNQEIPFSAALFTGFLCTLFGANAVAIKYSLLGIGPFTAAGIRFSIAGMAIYLWARFTGRPFALQKGQVLQILIICIGFTLQLGLLYVGFGKTTASRGTLMMNLQPFFLLLLAHWFIPGDRITKKKILGLIMGSVGMVLVFSGKKGVTASVQAGDFLILLTSFVWAANTVYTKRIIHLFSPFQLVFYPMLFCIPFFLNGGIFVGYEHDCQPEWTGDLRPFLSESRDGLLRIRGLEHHADEIRRRGTPFIHLYHAHRRCGPRRVDPRGTNHLGTCDGPDIDCMRHCHR